MENRKNPMNEYTCDLGADIPIQIPPAVPRGVNIAFAGILLAVILLLWRVAAIDTRNLPWNRPAENAGVPEATTVVVEQHMICSGDGTVLGTYTGEATWEGVPMGTGELILTDGTVCSGTWDGGAKEGVSYTLVFPNGSRYVGTLSEQYRPSGTGVYTAGNGEEMTLAQVEWVERKQFEKRIYTGMISEGMCWGYGVTAYDGGEYTGDYVRGRITGIGTCKYADGSIYEGSWKNNTRNGLGTYWELGENGLWNSRYEGNWVEGKRQGEATVTYYDGTGTVSAEYEGSFYEDRRHGQGSIVWCLLGSRYSGAWNRGDISGSGTFYPLKGEPVSGIWSWAEKKQLDAGVTGIYTGMLKEGKPWGYGYLLQTDFAQAEDGTPIRRLLEAEFREGKLHGYLRASQSNNPFVYYCTVADGQWSMKDQINDGSSCQVRMTVKLNGTILTEGNTYAVKTGDRIEVSAESSAAQIHMIGYRSNLNMDTRDTYGNTAVITVPEQEPGTKVQVFIEAVAANDDGTPNTIMKTGWRRFVFRHEQ